MSSYMITTYIFPPYNNPVKQESSSLYHKQEELIIYHDPAVNSGGRIGKSGLMGRFMPLTTTPGFFYIYE